MNLREFAHPLIDNQVDEADAFYDGGDDSDDALVELKTMDYQLYDQNYKILHKVKKMKPKMCHVVKPENTDTNIDLAFDGLQAF